MGYDELLSKSAEIFIAGFTVNFIAGISLVLLSHRKLVLLNVFHLAPFFTVSHMFGFYCKFYCEILLLVLIYSDINQF